MCWYCGSPIKEEGPFGHTTSCPECGRDLRSCRNCRFFSPGAPDDCTEPDADFVPDKERGNYCDWFSLNPVFLQQTKGNQSERTRAEEAKNAFNALFKD